MSSSSSSNAPSAVATSSAEQQLAQQVLKAQRTQEGSDKKAQRKAAQRQAQAQAQANGQANGQAKKEDKLRFLPREWARVEEDEDGQECHEGEVSLMTWNVLAQALVRRELFPNSDMLKIKDRIPSLMQEALHYSPTLLCLQEVDRLSDHLPSLTLQYDYTHFVGYKEKSHGLLIAWRREVFRKVGEKGIRLDDLAIHDDVVDDEQQEAVAPAPSSAPPLSTSAEPTPNGDSHPPPSSDDSSSSLPSRKARGLSRATRNVGLFVALRFTDGRRGGVILGTTHLFWHPQHVYERVRQTGILMREARRFRDQGEEEEWRDWPLFLAGDFNSQPRELTYSLLSRLPLTPVQLSELTRSTVVHQSVDLLHDPAYVPPPETEEQAAAKAHSVRSGKPLSEDEDKVIKNCREGQVGDGLATVEELKKLFEYSDPEETRVRSAYGEIGGKLTWGAGKGNQYCDRLPEVQSGNGWVVKEDPEVVRKRQEGTEEQRVRRGDYEPMWTNFTPLWRLSIDYIFLLPPSTLSQQPPTPPRFTSLLLTHPTADLGLGLPRLGVCGSDHVALAAKVQIPGL